jgi:hypothetical protein
LTTYYAKAFATNTAGTTYGPPINFSTSSTPVALGGQLQGGTVAYIYKSGDPGYVAGETHGIIMSNVMLNNAQTTSWSSGASVFSNATGLALGSGLTNSNTIYNTIGNNATAVNLCKNYSVTVNGVTYSNWYLPSAHEIREIHIASTSYKFTVAKPNYDPNTADVPWFYYDTSVTRALYIWTSSEVNASEVQLNVHNNGYFPIAKTYNGAYVRAVRYF